MAGAEEEESMKNVYHERQHLQFCLLHCLNNLLQGEEAFTREELDSIADGLPAAASAGSGAPNPLSLIFKPHRNAVTGNYDANVLIAALASRGKEVVWFDRRKGSDGLCREVARRGDDGLLGMVANFSKSWMLGLWRGRHWVAVRKLHGAWYDLDSSNAVPVCVARGDDEGELRGYLDAILANKGEVMLVLNDAAAPSEGKS